MTSNEALGRGFRRLHNDLTRRMREWAAPDGEQDALRSEFLAHLARHPDALAKTGPRSHFTASVLVLGASLDTVLLTHHRRAAKWLQFGGHYDAADRDVMAAATREVQEESGLQVIPQRAI